MLIFNKKLNILFIDVYKLIIRLIINLIFYYGTEEDYSNCNRQEYDGFGEYNDF